MLEIVGKKGGGKAVCAINGGDIGTSPFNERRKNGERRGSQIPLLREGGDRGASGADSGGEEDDEWAHRRRSGGDPVDGASDG